VSLLKVLRDMVTSASLHANDCSACDDLLLIVGDPMANIKLLEDPGKNLVVIMKDSKEHPVMPADFRLWHLADVRRHRSHVRF
jgi:hypothetical protein